MQVLESRGWRLASPRLGSSWAVQPPLPLPRAAEKPPGWEKENRDYIHALPPSTRGLDLLEPQGQREAHGAEGPTKATKTGGEDPSRLPLRPPGPSGSWVGAPCPEVHFGGLVAAPPPPLLPSPSPAPRAPTSAPARARSASREEVRRLVPGQAAHGKPAAAAPDSGSAPAVLQSPRDCEGVPGGLDSPHGYRSLATGRRPRPEGQGGPRRSGTCSRLRGPQVKALPGPAAPEIKLPAPHGAQLAIRRTRQQGGPGPPRSWGVAPHP